MTDRALPRAVPMAPRSYKDPSKDRKPERASLDAHACGTAKVQDQELFRVWRLAT